MVTAAVAGCAAAVLVSLALGAGATKAASSVCGETGWPATAEGAPASFAAGAYYAWHDRSGWHIRVTGGTGRISARVTGDAALKVTKASTALRLKRSARSLSFDATAGSRAGVLDFRAGCANRLSFGFGPQRPTASAAPQPAVYLGASGQSPGGAFAVQRPVATGITGRIIIGPTCPIVGTDVTCPPAKTAQGTVRIEKPAQSKTGGGTGQLVKNLQTEPNGTFSISLPPGTYLLVVVKTGADFNTAKPSVVTVENGVVTEVTLVLDTGIR